MNLFQDFADFILLLNKYKVDYLIVGGYAVGIHSQSRMTQDIDFWIKPTIENAENIILALKEFGFIDIAPTATDLIDMAQMIQFGRPPVRIDILNSIDGVEFEDAYKNRYINNFGPIKDVNFISFNDLIKNKSASQRNKDKADIEWLKTYGKGSKKI